MGSSLVGALIGGIIATSIGIFLHYSVGGRRQKKRLCMALHDELKLNHKYLMTSFSFQGKEYTFPYRLVLSSYADARSYGLLRELPNAMGTRIEDCYTFLQNLDTHRFGAATKGGEILQSEPKNETVDEVVETIGGILPKLEEFYSNLCIYPHDYVVHGVRRIRRAS